MWGKGERKRERVSASFCQWAYSGLQYKWNSELVTHFHFLVDTWHLFSFTSPSTFWTSFWVAAAFDTSFRCSCVIQLPVKTCLSPRKPACTDILSQTSKVFLMQSLSSLCNLVPGTDNRVLKQQTQIYPSTVRYTAVQSALFGVPEAHLMCGWWEQKNAKSFFSWVKTVNQLLISRISPE